VDNSRESNRSNRFAVDVPHPERTEHHGTPDRDPRHPSRRPVRPHRPLAPARHDGRRRSLHRRGRHDPRPPGRLERAQGTRHRDRDPRRRRHLDGSPRRLRHRAHQPVHRSHRAPGHRRWRIPPAAERGARCVPQPPGRRLRRDLRHGGQPARRPPGVRHHAPAGAPEHRRQRPGGPEHRGPEQPRRVQRVPRAHHARARRLREHPARGPAQPPLVVVDPPHPQRQGRRPGRPRHPRPDVRLRRGLRGRSGADDQHQRHRRRLLRARAEPVPLTHPGRPGTYPQRRRRRQASLAHLWHDAATQSGIAGTAWAAYQSVVEYVDHFAPVRDKADAATARALRLLTTDEPARIKARAWTALTPA
jgi:hypothetical protein